MIGEERETIHRVPVSGLGVQCCRALERDLAGWGNFYVMLGGAAAALTGLIVVAMSLHVRAIARSAPHRGLARGSLTGLVGLVVISGFALFPGQTTITFGAEIAAVGAVLFMTGVQRGVPGDVLGRVTALGSLGSVALLPAGFAIAGVLAPAIGIQPMLWVGAIVIFLATGLALRVPGVAHMGADAAARMPAVGG